MTQETTRSRVEEALYNAVPRGAYTDLASFRGVSRQNISKYYDHKSGDYQSVFSKALVELDVIARVRPDWARNILGVINEFGARWAGRPKAPAGMAEMIALAARVFDPETRYQDRLPLALRLQDEVNKMVDGLRYEDIEPAEKIGAD